MAYQSRYMREKYGESDNSFKEYVSRVQQAIDKAPEAQPEWPKNKKTQTPIFSAAQPSQPQPITRQASQTTPVDLSKMTEAEKVAYANDLLTQLNWQAAPDVQQKNAAAQGAGGSFSRTGAGRNDARLLGEKSPSASLLDKAGEFATKTLYDLSEGVANVLDFLTDPQKVNNLLYSDFVKDNVMAGLSGFNRSVAQTADFILPDVITVKPVQDVLNFYKNDGSGYEARAAATNQELEMETPGSLFQSAVQALPNAVLTLMSGGASDAAQLGGASGSTVSNVIQEAMKNPSFWSSFMRTAGASYEDAKASGANELAATVYGITNGLVSSGIEVGGGVEGMMDKNGIGGVLQTMYEEGSEEVKQNVIANLLAKILYNQDAEYFSMTDENAVFNPEREIKAFGGGAAIGGLFGGGNMILNSTRPTYDISQIYQYNADSETGSAAQPIATGTEASVPSMADMFPLSNKTPVQSETDALVNAFYNNTLTNAQIETLKPGGKNRAAFEAATGLTLPETASKTRALLKLGAEESIDGTLKTEYNGVNGGAQNGTDFGTGIGGVESGRAGSSNLRVQSWGQPAGNQRVFRQPVSDGTAYSRAGATTQELVDSTADPEYFSAQLNRAIKENKNGLMVSPKTPQELADSGAITFMSKDGMSGAAVTADGDIEAVFRIPGGDGKKLSYQMVITAVDNGGVKLDCYGEALVKNYSKMGFEPVAKVKWNPEYAPEGWNYGPKDVYVMKLQDGLDAAQIEAKLGLSETEGGFHMFTDEELAALPEMDYDEALAYRDSLLEQGAKPVAESASELYGQNTVGAAERNEHSFSALQNTYGTIEPGENPARVVDVPKSTNGKDKVRQFTRTAMEAKATTDELIPLFEQNVEDGLFSYNAKKDKPALDAAVRTITDKGWDGALAQWRDVVEGRTPAGKGNITLGQLLYAEAAKAGDTELAMQLAAEVAAEGTRAGQTVQALRLLKKMTPEGQLYYVNRVVDNLNRDIKAGNRTGIGVNWKTKRAIQSGEKTVEIPNYLAEQLLNAKTESEITDASTAIMKNVADQLPADWATKWNSWRYLAMLGNVRTHIRNIAGNAIFWPARQIKNMTGSWLEQLFVREPAKRTKAILNPFNDADKSRMSFAKNDFDQSMKTVVQGTGKLNPESVIRQNQTVFTSKAMKPIETLRKANSAALEWEDTVFSKNAYVDSMAGFMKARGLTEADMTGRTLEQARTYAINQAQKATYRDASALAKKISDLANTNAATRLVVGGTMPFTTTPINIAKRGIEYSPAGIAKAITYDLYQLQKGNMTATDVVEDLASGLTGTGIVALGAALASMGFLTGGGEDNKKEEQFKDMQGVQNYALQIGDSSYTIDWLAPISLPLFVGVETWNAFQEDGEFSLARVLDTMTSITEPMMNLTLLQGINSAIKTAGYSDNPVPDIMLNAAVGYAGQAVPTLAGQIARSIDDTRRATFTQTGAPLAQQDKSLQKIKNKIPFLSQTSQPYVDQWGRTQENTGGSFAGRLAYNMLSPGYYSKNKPTQVDNWLQQLYDRTGESSVLPSYAQKNFTKDGIKHNLTAEQYTAYAKERGQTAYDILEVLVPGYKDLTDQQAVHATEKAYTVATELAKQEALGIEPIKEVQNTIERAEKWGDGDWMAGIADILKANALTYNVKGDKIPGTDRTISGSAKKNKIAALVDAGYSQYQAMQLYDLLNG
ncbi:hypothetical protein [Ruthenibacterium lactatiformans]|uniref:hypothetical protein n=1 Tax=Ruthenibacterium lactatiformans TaxID=1550024 RepID=UPI00243124B9|nr:hypothetical protein [Ruthenibacterium lactatiformans]